MRIRTIYRQGSRLESNNRVWGVYDTRVIKSRSPLACSERGLITLSFHQETIEILSQEPYTRRLVSLMARAGVLTIMDSHQIIICSNYSDWTLVVCSIPYFRLTYSFTFVNPPCVCDRGDSSCSNKGKFDDDDDYENIHTTNEGRGLKIPNWPLSVMRNI